jgi:YozE SAM-like fold
MTFRTWLRRQQDRRDSVGMLAHDLSKWLHHPSGDATLDDYHAFLRQNGGDRQAFEALAEAWQEYHARHHAP